ncbi:MAG: helix-turn-helix domain-containing protein [Oscillospiraceae bacterium]|nr:helix-turn-helix domain-containing protein [Oscillospiraceae bacterium]
MGTTFSKALAQLRAERGIPQRAAAADLGISQALLSHYENGTREPGFAFLARAADYYGVTADFLLGRSATREGLTIQLDELYDAGQERDSRLSGVPSAKLGKRLQVNAVSVLYDLLSRDGDTALITAATGYLGLSLYRLYYLLYRKSGRNMEAYFPLSDAAFAPTTLAGLSLAEARLADLLEDKKRRLPEISGESLKEDYPTLAQSVLTVLHQAAQTAYRMDG